MKNTMIVAGAIGVFVGFLDVVPMVLQKLTWDANLSAFSMWIVVSIFMATSEFRCNIFLKAIIIAFICLIPSAFLIGWKEPFSLVPISLMTLLLGSLLGFLHKKFIGNR